MKIPFFRNTSNHKNIGVESQKYRYEIDISPKFPMTRLSIKIFDGDLGVIHDEITIDVSKQIVLKFLESIDRMS